MLKFEGVFFPGETLDSDLEDKILKKALLYFDKIYAIIPEVFNIKLANIVDEYDYQYHPEKLDEFSMRLVMAEHAILNKWKANGREIGEIDKSELARHERIINFLVKTELLREEGILEIINPDENIKSKPYYFDEDIKPTDFSIIEKFKNLSSTEINFNNIINYMPHLLYGNILEDLRDKEFRKIVKTNFKFDKVLMYKGQAEHNWLEQLCSAEDTLEYIHEAHLFGFCSKISSTMWASLIINHALISSFRKKAVPFCSNPILQNLMNRKIRRRYEKLFDLDMNIPNFKKDLSTFNLALVNLPNFELKSFEDIIEIRERLKDEMSEFRLKMCEFADKIKTEPYSETFINHLELIKRDNIQPTINNLHKKISSLNRKTIPRVLVATALNMFLCINPSLPPALAILACPDVFSLTTILNNYRKEYKDITEKNGLSYLIKIGNA